MSWLEALEEIRRVDWTQAAPAEREAKAREVVNISAYAASVTAFLPVPLVDLALLLPAHSAMVMTVGHVFGRTMTQAEAKRVALELGAVAGLSFAGLTAISALKKLLLPGIGGLLSIPATFALTWGLGRASISYFENPGLSREDLKKVFDDALREGKASFSKEAFDRFRGQSVERDAVETVPRPEPGSREDPPLPSEVQTPSDRDPLRRKKRTL